MERCNRLPAPSIPETEWNDARWCDDRAREPYRNNCRIIFGQYCARETSGYATRLF